MAVRFYILSWSSKADHDSFSLYIPSNESKSKTNNVPGNEKWLCSNKKNRKKHLTAQCFRQYYPITSITVSE